MTDPHERFWSRFRARAKLGGRRLYEQELQAMEWTGEGGIKLKEAEKDELGQRACADVTGQMFSETLLNRQVAKGLEKTKRMPPDWWIWAKKVEAKRQEQGG